MYSDLCSSGEPAFSLPNKKNVSFLPNLFRDKKPFHKVKGTTKDKKNNNNNNKEKNEEQVTFHEFVFDMTNRTSSQDQ